MLHDIEQSVRMLLQGERTLLRGLVERQGEQLVDGRYEACIVARVNFAQIRTAEDLIQTRGTFERADLFEHALVVASTLHAVDHQLLTANRQAIHLHGGIHDRKQQRSSHDRKADQHQTAQGFGPGHAHDRHSSSG
jgi:hypothetical protein